MEGTKQNRRNEKGIKRTNETKREGKMLRKKERKMRYISK
jgi:hypothetical protein